MLLNMALVWLMIVPWGWYMIYLLKCSMIIVLEWYFEITFIPRKKGLCWPSFRDYLHFDIRSAQSANRFYVPRFEMIYDFHFEMSNAFLFSFWNALWLSFRNEGAKFSYTKLFSSEKNQIFYWRKCIYYYYFRTQLFTQGIVSLSLRWNKFFKKGDGLLCQILIILQC